MSPDPIKPGPHNVASWGRFTPVQTESEDWQSYRSFKGQSTDTLSRRMRALALAQLVRGVAARGLPGKYIECGCYRGHSTHVIARTMTLCGVDRRLMVFDSFEGLSPAAPEDFDVGPRHVDRQGLQAQLRSGKQMFASSLEETKANLKEHGFIDYVKGWIPESFAGHEDERFAFAHVDLDLYQPVKAALEFIYPRMPAGGVILVDDYNFTDWPGAHRAVDAFVAAADPTFFFALPLGGAFLVK